MKTLRNPLELLRQSLRWTSWPEDPRLQLSTLQVPVDYDDLTGEHIQLHVSRLRADYPDQRRGVLVALNGGPGGAESMGVAMPLRLAATPLTSRYDIIGMDVRGYGLSSPLRFRPPTPSARFSSRPSEADFDAFVHDAKATERACANAAPGLRPHITTRNIARDLEVLREALQEDRVSMLGSAYGTSIVSTYGDMFPERLDRSVLDSCVHPEWGWEEQFRMQTTAIHRNVESWASWVASRHSTYGLGASASQVLRSVETVSHQLAHSPAAGELNQTMFDIALGNGSTRRVNWGLLAGSVQALRDGDRGADVASTLFTWAQAGLRAGTTPSFGPGERETRKSLNPDEETPDGFSEGQTHAITCETPWPRDLQHYRQNVAAYVKDYPYGLGALRAMPWCATFNETPPPEPARSLGERRYPIGLVIQAEGDPLDPLEGGVAMADHLAHHAVLVADDGGHDLYPAARNRWINEAVESYLLRGELPRERVRWVAGESRPDVPSDHLDTAKEQMELGLGDRDVPLADLVRWMDERRRRNRMEIDVIPLSSLGQWSTERDGTLVHSTGRFFSVAGVHVTSTQEPGESTQPIIHQPEVGILGFLAKQVNGVPYVLVQAKVEPGNPSGTQIAPTVQATTSNYTASHCGSDVPYVEYFLDLGDNRVLVDCEQSEHGQWYFDKHNRNIIIEVTDDVPELPDYRWMSLEQVHGLLNLDDMVGMSARSVLGSLHTAPQGSRSHDDFTNAVVTSLRHQCPMELSALTTWFHERRHHHQSSAVPVPLSEMDGWAYTPVRISDLSRSQFDVIGVSVTSAAREVAAWDQPMIAPHGTGLAVLFVREGDGGYAQALARASVEPGFVGGLEIGATLQVHTGDLSGLSTSDQRVLEHLRSLPPESVWYDTVQSEEGGRIYESHTRYMIVRCAPDFVIDDPDYHWATLSSWTSLAAKGRSINVQARTLLAATRARCGNSQPGQTYANYISEELP